MSSLKSTAIYLPGILIPRAMSLALIIIMTHFLPKSEYGLLTLVITVGELVDTSLTTWVRLALLRLGAGGRISTGLASVVLKTVLATTAIGCVVGFIVAIFVIKEDYIRFWMAVSTYTCGISLLRFGLALLQLENKSITYTALEISRAIISFGLATISTYFFGAEFIYPSLAVSLTTCAFAAIAIRTGLRSLSPSTAIYNYRDVTAFAGPLLILSVLTIVANAMDRLFLQSYWGAATVGAYAATYALARQPIDVIANAINTGGYPALVNHFESGGRIEAETFLRNQFGFFLKFMLPVAAVLYAIQGDLFVALLPADYRDQAGSVFGWIMVGAMAYNLRSALFDNVYLVERRNILQLKYFVVVFLVGITVAALAIPRLGVIGSSYVFASWTVLALGCSALFGRSLIRITVSRLDLLRALLLAVIAGGLVSLVHHWLINEPPFFRLAFEGVAATVGFFGGLIALHGSEARAMFVSARLKYAR
jgi:O-antigen/teichoic acid export membrane protein